MMACRWELNLADGPQPSLTLKNKYPTLYTNAIEGEGVYEPYFPPSG